MDFQVIDRWLEDHYPDLEKALCDSLRIPSVKGAAQPGKPFGAEVNDALEHVLGLCAEMGLKTENQDGYVAIADLPGSGEGQVGILSHLDVVPAEAGKWTTQPYEPSIRDGKIYARGAVDDKGPAFAALFAGKALMACGFWPKKTVRYIFGGDEESGCGCMLYYTAHNSPPDCGFTPDGSFPAIVGEKGGAMFKLVSAWSNTGKTGGLHLQNITAGTAINVIPEQAQATLLCTAQGGSKLPCAEGIKIEHKGDHIVITAEGKGGHASTPWEGDNALYRLLAYLNHIEFTPEGAKRYVGDLVYIFEDHAYGSGLGVADEDEFGRLTCVPSIIQVNDAGGEVSCDMRTPVTRSPKSYLETLTQTASKYDMSVEGWDDYPELYVPEDSEFVQTLMKVYRDCTGDMSEPLIIGGGTYAKHFKNFVAFGPQRQGDAEVAHQADEYISQSDLLEIAKIYARAIYELAK